MPVRIQINIPQVGANVTGAWEKSLEPLATEIREDCNKYCKERDGTLIRSSLIHSQLDQGRLIWQTPYAKRQYWEIETAHKDKNPNASWKWCEVAKAKFKEKWKRLAERLLKEHL